MARKFKPSTSPTMPRERVTPTPQQQKAATAAGSLSSRKKKNQVDALLDQPTTEELLNFRFDKGRQVATADRDSSAEDSSSESDVEPVKPTPAVRKSSGTGKARGKVTPREEEYSDKEPVKRTPTGRKSSASGKSRGNGTPRDEEYSDQEPPKRTPTGRKSSASGKARGNGNTRDAISINSVSSSDMQTEKEKRRVQDADHRKSDSSSNKIINQYKAQVQTLRDSSQQKRQTIDDLTNELDELKEKYGLLEHNNGRILATLQHIRNNPEELVRQVAKKGPSKRGSKSIKAMTKRAREQNEGEDEVALQGALLSSGREAVRSVYRTFKFISNDKQEKMYLGMVMDNLGKENLLIQPGATDERKAQVEKNREEICKEFGAFWISELNNHRTYVQGQCKKGVMEWMVENNVDKLPETKVLTDIIAIRDFSRFDILDTDTEEQKAAKRAGLLGAQEIMDMYTEKLVPGIAGTQLYHPKIRHFEEMTTSLMPGTGMEQLRIPAATEAMAIMAYDNNKKKWEAMRAWKKRHPGSKTPRYKASEPTINVEFMELYSCSSIGQSSWGGWSIEGKKIFNKLQAKIHESRIKNRDRHVKYDQECVARLYEKYQDMHKGTEPPAKKQKTTPEINPDDDEELDFIIEL